MALLPREGLPCGPTPPHHTHARAAPAPLCWALGQASLCGVELAEGAHRDGAKPGGCPHPRSAPTPHRAMCSPSSPGGLHPPGNAEPWLVNAGATDATESQPPARSPAFAPVGKGGQRPLPQGPAVPPCQPQPQRC